MGHAEGLRGLHIAGLLGVALNRLRAEILADSERGFPELRVSHFRLLELIPDSGARITDLAEIAGMTKQGLGQHIDYLQERGYADSERVAGDRRVRLVRRTALGDQAVEFSRAAIDRVEQEWRERLGADRFELLREALVEVCGPLDDELEWLGRP
ncbi:MarR family winged helix-turn-helix transcriptional regulator [Streptomyces sp. SID13031]|uniref:MarR family transcriptional regulator n=1 Tax=Streptomyces sp. SID13031 TaxID=2706046 RepID=UPI0013C8DE23|nr:winged helix-turn-helix transcriptional regulator [Streptomyces sp. SID13031]